MRYGTWPSSLSVDVVAGQTLRFGQVHTDGGLLYWTESRPLEAGRSVIVRREHDGTMSDVIPDPYSARSRIHEYGGGEFLAASGSVYFVNASDQDIYSVDADGNIVRLTDAPDMRFGNMLLDSDRDRLIAVAERHSGSHDPMPRNMLVAIPLVDSPDLASGDTVAVLASGNDFYSSPALDRNHARLAWLEWSLPSMPWEGATLQVAEVNGDGSLAGSAALAGGDGSAVFQPEWLADGSLVFVWNRTGWGNLHRWDGHSIETIVARAAEFAQPQWALGMRSYAVGAGGSILASFFEDGLIKCGEVAVADGTLNVLECDARSFYAMAPLEDRFAAVVTFDDRPPAVAVIDPSSDSGAAVLPVKLSAAMDIEAADVSSGRPVRFEGPDGRPIHAIHYAPANSSYEGPEGEAPPAVVLIHGGPTGFADRGLKPKIQYWTSRGFAVLDVDFTGSFGYGRDYREALNGAWGKLDAADAAAAAEWLIREGLADSGAIAISGGSSGGYTALCALTNHNVFAAAAVYYGISDVALLADSTHKFESGYVSTLTDLPQDAPAEAYREISPLYQADLITSPVILFQGLDDKVVPPDQSQAIVEELKQRGVPVCYLEFEGEAHGFRDAETLMTAIRSEHAFFARVMGFEPSDELPTLDIHNLESPE